MIEKGLKIKNGCGAFLQIDSERMESGISTCVSVRCDHCPIRFDTEVNGGSAKQVANEVNKRVAEALTDVCGVLNGKEPSSRFFPRTNAREVLKSVVKAQ